MITDLKTYAIIVLSLWCGIAHYQTYKVEKEYTEYKESINDQLQKAIAEKARIEAEQRAKLAEAERDYNNLRRDLDAALGRLSKPGTVPRKDPVPVAGGSSSGVSRTSENTTGAIDPAEIAACIRQSSFFAQALRDTLQCSRLIEFVRP